MSAEPSLHDQLIAARKAIVAQLDEMAFRGENLAGRGGPRPPDYRPEIAELTAQLREIDEFLNPDPNPSSRT